MIPIAWPDNECDHLIGFNADIQKRAELDRFGSLRDTRSKPFSCGSASYFQGPGNTVATLGMGVHDLARDRELVSGNRAFPRDNRSPIWGRVRGDAVGFHRAGYPHAPIG